MSGATAAVLLPLRIETRFDGSRLRLRVVPDEPWFDRFDPLPVTGELDGLERYVAVAGRALGTPDARQAWRTFAGHVGPARAWWLYVSFVSDTPDGGVVVERPDVLREEARLPELPVFPDQLQVWLARGGQPPARALTLQVDHGRLRADFPDPEDPGDRRWWESWDEAVATGLAGEIDLGASPNDIDVLYVVGLGDGEYEPARLFEAHEGAGSLGLLAPGTATNTVDGAPAADLGQDPDAWLDAMASPTPPSSGEVSTALTGVAGMLGLPLNRAGEHRLWSQGLVAGLWPALWGFAQKNVWALGHAQDLPAWAARAVCPEGAFPTLRIGDQPYGLLPVTELARWQAADGDPTVEAAMAEPLRVLCAEWARVAEGRGTVEGARTQDLLDRLAQVPTSPGYRHRDARSLQLWLLSMLYLGYGTGWRDVDVAWQADTPLARELGLAPRRRYAAAGGSAPLAIPLVTPAGDTSAPTGELLRLLVGAARTTPALLADEAALEQQVFGSPPDSLLLRLAVRALQVAVGDVGRALLQDTWWLGPIARDALYVVPLERWVQAVTAADLQAATPEAAAFARVAEGLTVVADLADTDEVRLDGLLRATLDCATFRIDAWVAGPPTRRLLDLVESPPDDGRGWRLGAYGWVDRPGPGASGPTPAGMLHAPSQTQAITAMVLRDRAVSDPEPARWHMDLTSRTVRAADRLAAAVQAGAHLSEVLGREVERVVGRPDVVDQLRRDFPIRAEHAGRRVCDGQMVLAADPSSLGLWQQALAALGDLRAGVDAYGDLLVAEAVHDVVDGRAETAGAVMDAAAGLARPPELSVLRTQRDGRGVSTTCVVALPATDPPVLPADSALLSEVSPGTLADPAFAAFLVAQVGAAGTWTWTTGAGASVTLADLGLEPVDAIALPLDDLERLASNAVGAPTVSGTSSDRHGLAVRLATLVGQNPAVPSALAEHADAGAAPLDDAELRGRVTDAVAVGQALLARLGSASEADRTAALRAAVRWGIAPVATPGVDDDVPERARELLRARLAAVPDVSAAPRDDVVRALSALVSPTGQLAVLARMPRSDVPAGLAPAPTLDEAWLAVVAAVREPLARLEAHQLAAGSSAGAGPALTAWSNRPDDPWQTAPPHTRLVTVHAPAGLDLATVPPDSAVAVALLDRFSETVPGDRHSTSVAFGFAAPTSRAPQAILLAVPPDPAVPLDTDGLVRILAETRQLAHARMARPADLGSVQALLPAALLPADGAMRVPLDPSTAEEPR